ncbi:uncharacterized protein LOC128873815 isoform X1 [Hylaeus volcanicus]|uniref:uncharacterized protein LOC128873815 isoform X1 n=1 Tax=Hylaeus volcanicus TaxID=313075 RepID=UPI0023B77B6B|nr:uncharacterized protein LOC128873815 isoform X1 [Hylaeus volcanicus]
MSEFRNLANAIKRLKKSVSDFPIGAVSLDDYTPVEERIRNMRELLKFLNARLITLKAHYELQTRDEPEEGTESIITCLHEETANTLITAKVIKFILHTEAIQAILTGKEGDSDMQNKIYDFLCQLFSLNDKIIFSQTTMQDALQKQLNLKIECQNTILEYKKFLKTQEEMLSKQLQETNPEIARQKEKTKILLQKINLMKKLIVNLIAVSNDKLRNPFLFKKLQEHRELITIDTVLKMSHDITEDINANTSRDENITNEI